MALEIGTPTKEQRFVESVRYMVTTLAQVREDMPTIEEIWQDRQYATEITDQVLEDMRQDITAAQLVSGIVLFQQVVKLFNNEAVTQGDYGVTLSTLRTDK